MLKLKSPVLTLCVIGRKVRFMLIYYLIIIHIYMFIGGDDVQQLCEAGEEEFLEIMALVGMASKPLHVRRLQKALQEWALNPGAILCTPQISIICYNAYVRGREQLEKVND